MMREIPESDWKLFRELRVVALEKFCERTLGEVKQLTSATNGSYHERYLDVYRRIEDRDKELADAFNDPRRSQMVVQLMRMQALGLIGENELARFSHETQVLLRYLSARP